jgi:hypothetical protein
MFKKTTLLLLAVAVTAGFFLLFGSLANARTLTLFGQDVVATETVELCIRADDTWTYELVYDGERYGSQLILTGHLLESGQEAILVYDLANDGFALSIEGALPGQFGAENGTWNRGSQTGDSVWRFSNGLSGVSVWEGVTCPTEPVPVTSPFRFGR